MPATSVAQQHLFGAALAYKRGKNPNASDEVKRIAESMDEETIGHYAETSHEGLPKHAVFTGDIDFSIWKDGAKEAAAAEVPLTGPDAIHHALQRLNLEKLEANAKAAVKSGRVTKRPGAVKLLNVLEGLRRNEVMPQDLMIQSVPVLPPAFRPFSMLGDTFVPGDANELYREVFDMIDAHKGAAEMFGDSGSQAERMHLYDSVKALYGYGEPVKPKTKQRGVSGFLQQVTGANPKFGVVQRRLLSKAQDSVSRGVISIGADLGLDEIGVPEEMAWTMYAPYIQGRLSRLGLSNLQSLQHLKDRSPMALKALNMELEERPVVYSRAPSWHKFNVIAGRAKLIPGDTIAINPFVTTGLNADFDGDTINLHVPSQRDAVQEAHEKLLPSKMLFSIRNQDKIVPSVKHEQLLGLFTANRRPAKQMHSFTSSADAMKALREERVPLSDEIEVPDE